MSDQLPAQTNQPRVRYWDHNFNEIQLPDNLNVEHITVDYDGTRYASRVVSRAPVADQS